MQIVVSFIGGLAVGLVLFFDVNNQMQVNKLHFQQQINSCNNELTIVKAEKNGMLLNK
jgi:hypothetical protein